MLERLGGVAQLRRVAGQRERLEEQLCRAARVTRAVPRQRAARQIFGPRRRLLERRERRRLLRARLGREHTDQQQAPASHAVMLAGRRVRRLTPEWSRDDACFVRPSNGLGVPRDAPHGTSRAVLVHPPPRGGHPIARLAAARGASGAASERVELGRRRAHHVQRGHPRARRLGEHRRGHAHTVRRVRPADHRSLDGAAEALAGLHEHFSGHAHGVALRIGNSGGEDEGRASGVVVGETVQQVVGQSSVARPSVARPSAPPSWAVARSRARPQSRSGAPSGKLGRNHRASSTARANEGRARSRAR